MSLLTVLIFAGCCGLGAMLRYLADALIPRNGLLWVNTIGSLLAGLTTGWLFRSDSLIMLLLVTGMAGSLTTFSTVSVKAATALLDGHYRHTIVHWAQHLGGGLVAAGLGFVIGMCLS